MPWIELPDRILHNEKEILLQVANGDERAFNELFNHYWDHLYNYLRRITKSHEIAEEVASDVFLKLWTGREMISNVRNMDSFLFRVGHNKAIDFLKLAAKTERLQKVVVESMGRLTAPAADNKILDAEIHQIIADAIMQLSPQRRLIFTLSRMDGLTNDEIAERLNLSRNTVKNTLRDSLRFIRDFLKKKSIHGLVILWLLTQRGN